MRIISSAIQSDCPIKNSPVEISQPAISNTDSLIGTIEIKKLDLAGVNKLQKVKENEKIISQTINVENEIDLIRHLELKKEEEQELEELRQESIKRIEKCFEENGIVIREVSEEEMAFIEDCINSINELEEKYLDVPKTYSKKKKGK